jgi:hypothetical protein
MVVAGNMFSFFSLAAVTSGNLKLVKFGVETNHKFVKSFIWDSVYKQTIKSVAVVQTL